MATAIYALDSRSGWVTDGVQTLWDFSFSGGYLDQTHVKAMVVEPDGTTANEVVLTPASFIGPFRISITPAVPNGKTLIIFRKTPKNLPLVDFLDGARIGEGSLDIIAKQGLFVAAEAFDSLDISSETDLALAVGMATTSATAAAASAVTAASGASVVLALAGPTGSSNMGFIAAGPGAVARTAQSKMRDKQHARDYGAVGDGTADDTVALKRLFDYCIPLGLTAVLAGNYLVSGPISSTTTIAVGQLHIECDGDVTINVSAGAAADIALLYCFTTAINSSSKTGGRLVINLNNRFANGIYLRHSGGDGGHVNWGPITVTNAKALGSGDTGENQGLLVFGRYVSVNMDHPIVSGVDRVNTAGGACKGISVSEVVGQVTLESPTVSRVLCTGSTADADGISIFGRQLNGVYGYRAGTAQVNNAVFTDCQGRSFKAQLSEAILYRPRVFRKSVVTFATADIDFQVSNGVLIEPLFEYRLNSGVTPLHPNFYPVSFQQQATDAPSKGHWLGGVIRSEVALERAVFVTVGSGAFGGEIVVDGVSLQQIGAFTGGFFTAAFMMFNATQVAASTGKTHLEVNRVRGNLTGAALIGYNSFVSPVNTKLSFSAVGNENTGATHANSKVFGATGGSAITSVLAYNLSGNRGLNDLFVNWTIDFATIPVGCQFNIDIATATASNAPAWGASGIALVEGIGMYGVGGRNIRVTKDNATTASSCFYTSNGGTTWGTIK